MTEISEKEVRAVADVLLGRVNAPEQEIYRAARDGLEAAALARAEANAGEPVAWQRQFPDGKWSDDFSRDPQSPEEWRSWGFDSRPLYTHPAPQPSGTVGVKPLANLIHDALAFAVWAAGEGLCPTDGPPAPEDFLYAYSAATGFENWDAIPHHGATTLSALTAGKPEQVPSVAEAERERIANALEEEADTTPCSEDAVVVRDCARLVRANFSYEDAERLAEEAPAAPTAGGGE